MKYIYGICVSLLTMFSLSPNLLAQNNPVIPKIDQVERIAISSHNGWALEIRPDGSATLSYGSLPTDNADIPRQTFSFRSVYELLVPHLNGKYINPNVSYFVFMYVKNAPPGTPTNALYLDDRRIIRKIMIEARDKSVPLDQNRFKELIAKHPPVPTDAQ